MSGTLTMSPRTLSAVQKRSTRDGVEVEEHRKPAHTSVDSNGHDSKGLTVGGRRSKATPFQPEYWRDLITAQTGGDVESVVQAKSGYPLLLRQEDVEDIKFPVSSCNSMASLLKVMKRLPEGEEEVVTGLPHYIPLMIRLYKFYRAELSLAAPKDRAEATTNLETAKIALDVGIRAGHSLQAADLALLDNFFIGSPLQVEVVDEAASG